MCPGYVGALPVPKKKLRSPGYVGALPGLKKKRWNAPKN